jgi:hypothetical protein
MVKLIKFDLQINNQKITNLQELQAAFCVDVIPLFQDGRLSRFLKTRGLHEMAETIDAIDQSKNELQLIAALGNALEVDGDSFAKELLRKEELEQKFHEVKRQELFRDLCNINFFESDSSSDLIEKLNEIFFIVSEIKVDIFEYEIMHTVNVIKKGKSVMVNYNSFINDSSSYINDIFLCNIIKHEIIMLIEALLRMTESFHKSKVSSPLNKEDFNKMVYCAKAIKEVLDSKIIDEVENSNATLDICFSGHNEIKGPMAL